MKRMIKISKTDRSGVNLYMCEQATAGLGGVGANVSVGVEPAADGSRVFTVRRGGKYTISSHTNPLLPGRVAARELWHEGERIADVPDFAALEANWHFEDGVLTATIPTADRLPAPIPYRPRAPYTRGKGKKVTAPVGVSHNGAIGRASPHERLKICLRELNDLLNPEHGGVSDVELTAVSDGKTVRIVGPVKGRRIEEFG